MLQQSKLMHLMHLGLASASFPSVRKARACSLNTFCCDDRFSGNSDITRDDADEILQG
jgi:hypothetical protein